MNFNSFGDRINSWQQTRRVGFSRVVNLANSNDEFPWAKRINNTGLLGNLSLKKQGKIRGITEIHGIFTSDNSWSFLAGDEKQNP